MTRNRSSDLIIAADGSKVVVLTELVDGELHISVGRPGEKLMLQGTFLAMKVDRNG